MVRVGSEGLPLGVGITKTTDSYSLRRTMITLAADPGIHSYISPAWSATTRTPLSLLPSSGGPDPFRGGRHQRRCIEEVTSIGSWGCLWGYFTSPAGH